VEKTIALSLDVITSSWFVPIPPIRVPRAWEFLEQVNRAEPVSAQVQCFNNGVSLGSLTDHGVDDG
jgi:hypothetical protein